MTWLLSNWKLVLVGLALAISHAFAWRGGGAGAREDLADYKLQQTEQRLLADRAQRVEETRRQAAVDQEAQHAQTRIASLESDLAAARPAADSLHDAAAGTARRACSRPQSAAAGAAQPDPGALDLLVDVLTRHDRAAGELAEFADRLRIAGEACERAYDGLQPAAR